MTAGRRPVWREGQSTSGAATTGTLDCSRSRHTSTAHARTTRPARIMPSHIVRCGVQVIVTVVGVVDGGNRHPLNPPDICCGGPRSLDPALACQPSFKTSPRISQHPSGQLETVAVRVVRLRWTVTDGAAVLAAVPESVVFASINTTRSTSIPVCRPGWLSTRWVPAARCTSADWHGCTSTCWPANSLSSASAVRSTLIALPSTDTRSVRHPGCGDPACGATIDVDSISLIATGSTVVSPYRRSTVVRGTIASTVNVIESALAVGKEMVLRPTWSGAGTSIAVERSPIVTTTREIELCCSSTICVSVSVDVGSAGSRGMVNCDPTALENGDVHAVVGSPSMACTAVELGSPVSRRFDTAVAVPDKVLSNSSGALSSRCK